MSQLSNAPPVTGERLVLLQPAALDSLDLIKAAQADLTRQIRDALKSGTLVLGSSGVVLREFSQSTDAVLFMLAGGLLVGRIADSAEVEQAHAASHSRRKGLYR